MTQQLNVKNLVVDLQQKSGMARAVDALNLTLQKGQTFALVANRVAVNP
jgi:peptide/nickel transport system ATP-binding protein